MKLILTLTLSIFLLNLSAQEGLINCKHQCKVSRLLEEGVLLGVKVNAISKCKRYSTINEVIASSSAEKSGLMVGDVILKVDDKELSETENLYDIIQTYKAGDKVVITYVTGALTKKMKLRLGAKTTKIIEVIECCDELTNGNDIAINDHVSIFPNPASTHITIQTKVALEGDTHILIYSVDGKEMYYDFKNMNENLNLKVNTTDYINGPYFIRIETAKANYIQKFEIRK